MVRCVAHRVKGDDMAKKAAKKKAKPAKKAAKKKK